jgi:hypothetical protein
VQEAQLEVWYRLLQNLSSGELEEAIMHICKTTKDFYPGTNVVALILETVEVQNKEKRSKALQERNEAKKKEDEKQKLLIKAEFEEDPEAFKNRRKSKALAAQIGRVM